MVFFSSLGVSEICVNSVFLYRHHANLLTKHIRIRTFSCITMVYIHSAHMHARLSTAQVSPHRMRSTNEMSKLCNRNWNLEHKNIILFFLLFFSWNTVWQAEQMRNYVDVIRHFWCLPFCYLFVAQLTVINFMNSCSCSFSIYLFGMYESCVECGTYNRAWLLFIVLNGVFLYRARYALIKWSHCTFMSFVQLRCCRQFILAAGLLRINTINLWKVVIYLPFSLSHAFSLFFSLKTPLFYK